jgi:hypothetical protein
VAALLAAEAAAEGFIHDLLEQAFGVEHGSSFYMREAGASCQSGVNPLSVPEVLPAGAGLEGPPVAHCRAFTSP